MDQDQPRPRMGFGMMAEIPESETQIQLEVAWPKDQVPSRKDVEALIVQMTAQVFVELDKRMAHLN